MDEIRDRFGTVYRVTRTPMGDGTTIYYMHAGEVLVARAVLRVLPRLYRRCLGLSRDRPPAWHCVGTLQANRGGGLGPGRGGRSGRVGADGNCAAWSGAARNRRVSAFISAMSRAISSSWASMARKCSSSRALRSWVSVSLVMVGDCCCFV